MHPACNPEHPACIPTHRRPSLPPPPRWLTRWSPSSRRSSRPPSCTRAYTSCSSSGGHSWSVPDTDAENQPRSFRGGGGELVALFYRLSPSPSPRSSPSFGPYPSSSSTPLHPPPHPPPRTLTLPGARQRAGRRRLDPRAVVLQPALLRGSLNPARIRALGSGRGGVGWARDRKVTPDYVIKQYTRLYRS